MATGWLGWPPDTAWRTPIPQILIALTARLEWMNPSQRQTDKSLSVADKIKAAFKGRKPK